MKLREPQLILDMLFGDIRAVVFFGGAGKSLSVPLRSFVLIKVLKTCWAISFGGR